MISQRTTNATEPTSKKPSDASSNSTPKLPDQPVIFIDEALGRHVIANALRAAGARVEVHADHFTPGERDEIWLAEVAGRGWIVLSKDLRIRYRGLALKAIERTLARVFVLKRSEDLTGPEMAEIFVQALPAIYRKARDPFPPFIAKVGKDGSVAHWWPLRTGRSRKRVK